MSVETVLAGVSLGIGIILFPISVGGSIKASYRILRTSALRNRCLPHLILLITSAITSLTIICLEFIPILLLSLGIHIQVLTVLWMFLMPSSKALMFSSMIYIGVERLRRCHAAFMPTSSPLPGLFFIVVSSLSVLTVNIYKIAKMNIEHQFDLRAGVNMTGPVQRDLVLPVDEQHTIMYSITLVALSLIYILAVVYIRRQGKRVDANRTVSTPVCSRPDPNMFYMSSLQRPEIVPRERISSLGTDDMTCPAFSSNGTRLRDDDSETVRKTPVVSLRSSDEEQPSATISYIKVAPSCYSRSSASSHDTYWPKTPRVKKKRRRMAKAKVVPLNSKIKETSDIPKQGLGKIGAALRKLSSVSLFSIDPILEVYTSQEENEIMQKIRLRPLRHTRRSAGNVWHSGERGLSPVYSETTIGTDQINSSHTSTSSTHFTDQVQSAQGSQVTDPTGADQPGDVCYTCGSKTKKYNTRRKRGHKRSKVLNKQTSKTSMRSENSRASNASSCLTSCSDRYGSSRSKEDSGCLDDLHLHNSHVASDRKRSNKHCKVSSISADMEETSFGVGTHAAKQSNDEFIGTWEQLSTDIQNPTLFRRAHSLVNLNPRKLDYSTLSKSFPSENEPPYESHTSHCVVMESCSTQTDDRVGEEKDQIAPFKTPSSKRPVIIKITRPSQASSDTMIKLPSNKLRNISEYHADSVERRLSKVSIELPFSPTHLNRGSCGSASSDVDFYLQSPGSGLFSGRSGSSVRSSRSTRSSKRTMSNTSCTISKKDTMKSIKTSCILMGMFLVLYLPHTIMFAMSEKLSMKAWSIMCPMAVLLEFVAVMLNSYFYVYTNRAVMRRLRPRLRGQ
ncbi:unnamed protein product [Owenia fusiformis]|uniref:Uncharacterized protein n=1 Tax=Owenia fusiformis TaxID=6347 RepID=A0A8J1TUZ5_OWEFU|nr:unnamed protein product [Owenia fusiformis]